MNRVTKRTWLMTVFIGILLLYVMYKGLGFLRLAGYINTMVRGIVLLMVVFVDAFMTQSGTKKVK